MTRRLLHAAQAFRASEQARGSAQRVPAVSRTERAGVLHMHSASTRLRLPVCEQVATLKVAHQQELSQAKAGLEQELAISRASAEQARRMPGACMSVLCARVSL